MNLPADSRRRRLEILCSAVAALTMGAFAGDPGPLPPVPAMAVLYGFDEGSGWVTADLSGHGRDGHRTDSVAWEAGLFGTALRFAAPDSYLSVGPVEEGQAVPAGVALGPDWTLQAWTRFPLETTEAGWRTLALDTGGHHHVVVDRDGMLGTIVTGGFHPCGYDVDGLEGWHLLSAVGSAGLTTFFVDAVCVGVSAAQQTRPIRYIGNYVPLDTHVGHQNWGAVDSLRILEAARSAPEITEDALWTPGTGSPTPTPPVPDPEGWDDGARSSGGSGCGAPAPGPSGRGFGGPALSAAAVGLLLRRSRRR